MAETPKKRTQSLTSQYFGSDAVTLADIEQMVSMLRLPWEHILAAAEIPKSSLSRTRHGTAGVKTTDRLLKIVEQYARTRGIPDDDVAKAAVDALHIEEQFEAAKSYGQVRESRRVIVETARGDRFLGWTTHTASEIVDSKAVQISAYREIAKGVALSDVLAFGTKEVTAKQFGPQIGAQALLLDVVSVREFSPDAAEALRLAFQKQES